MKKFGFILILFTLVISLQHNLPATAQAPSGTWTSSISCQNQDLDNPATVGLLFYAEGSDTGGVPITGQDTIPAGKSINFVIESAPTGAKGSVVVSSDKPVTCSTEHSKKTSGTLASPYRFAASKGFDDTEIGPTMYVSQVETKFYGWESYIAIQNTSGSPVEVKVTFVSRTGTPYDLLDEFTIPASSNHMVYLNEVTGLPYRFIGGATITALDGTTPLAVTTAFYNTGSNSSTSQIHAWNGSSKGSNILYAPYLVRNYYGYQSGITIQNVGTNATSFKITYTFNGRNYVYQYPSTLANGEVKDFYLPNVSVLRPVDGFTVQKRFGKAVIEATNPDGTPNLAGELIANINQDNRGGAGIPVERAGQGATYGAFPSNAGSNTAYIAKWMRNVGGFSSGFNVSNFSDTSVANCAFTFVDDADANFTRTIAANSDFSIWAPNVAYLNNDYNAGVIIECDSEVFVITNAAANPGSGKYGDSFYQLEAGTPPLPSP